MPVGALLSQWQRASRTRDGNDWVNSLRWCLEGEQHTSLSSDTAVMGIQCCQIAHWRKHARSYVRGGPILSMWFYAPCRILHNWLKKLLAHLKAIFLDFMQNLHSQLIFLEQFFIIWNVSKKSRISIKYVLHKTARKAYYKQCHRSRHIILDKVL